MSDDQPFESLEDGQRRSAPEPNGPELPCDQHGCQEPALFYYEWPGSGALNACVKHTEKAMTAGVALGFILRFARIGEPLP